MQLTHGKDLRTKKPQADRENNSWRFVWSKVLSFQGFTTCWFWYETGTPTPSMRNHSPIISLACWGAPVPHTTTFVVGLMLLGDRCFGKPRKSYGRQKETNWEETDGLGWEMIIISHHYQSKMEHHWSSLSKIYQHQSSPNNILRLSKIEVGKSSQGVWSLFFFLQALGLIL